VHSEVDTQTQELAWKLENAESLVRSLNAAVEDVRVVEKEETEAIVGANDKEMVADRSA